MKTKQKDERVCGDCSYCKANFGGKPNVVKWCVKHRKQTRRYQEVSSAYFGMICESFKVAKDS